MSLLIHLPLNGNLENKGLLGDVEITSLGTTTYTNGKIGQCYQRATTSTQSTNGININNNLVDLLGSHASVAMWVKPLGTHTHYNGTLLSSGNWNSSRWAFGVSQDNSRVDVLCGRHNTYANCAVPQNEWTHLCSIYDNGTCTLYKNGEYIGQFTCRQAFNSDATNTCIGRETYANGYFGFNGLINDVRIYDHCLSPKEVHDLAQGLVLHYKLDDEYVEGTINYLDIKSEVFSSWSSYGFGSKGIKSIEPTSPAISGEVCKVTSGSTDAGNRSIEMATYCTALSLEKNNTCTFSAYVKGIGSTIGKQCFLHVYNTNGTNTRSVKIATTTLTGEWKRVYGQYTWTYDNPSSTNFNVYVVGVISPEESFLFCNPQLEMKDHVTPYVNKTRNNSIIYDSSGYQNNGSIVGNLTIQSDSARYTNSTSFDGNTSGILIQNFNLSNIINTALTYSFWIKPNGENGARSVYFGSYSGASFSLEKTATNKLRLWWNGSPDLTSTLTIVDDQWQHIAITKSGNTEIKAYLNGALIQTFTQTFNNITFPTTYRIGRDSRDGATSYHGLISDFRIYTTVLSDDDILDLYKVGASVDNQQNFYTYEIEENGIGRIGKNGVSQFDVLESNDECKIYKQVNANLFLEEPRSVTPTGYLAYQLNMSENLVAGETYTMQLWDVDMTGSASSRLYVYWGGGSVQLFMWYASSNFTNGHADHLVKTFTVTSSQASGYNTQNLWLNLYNYPSSSTDKNMHIGAWKLEKGSVATPLLTEDRQYDTTVQCNQLIEI